MKTRSFLESETSTDGAEGILCSISVFECVIFSLMERVGFLVFVLFAALIIPKDVHAGLVTVDKNGEVVWKVLSDEDELVLEVPRHSYIEVKKTSETETQEGSEVSLVKKGDKVSLMVLSNNETRELDVSGADENLIEVEERAEVQKINVGLAEGKFSLQQKGITAITEFPVKINPKTAEFSLKTSTGEKFLSILPVQAVQILLRSRLLTRISGNRIDIVEEDNDLMYLIKGEKEINLLNIFSYAIQVESSVSVSTGKILSLDAPVWYKMVAFIIS